jgi:hypothetical protein
MTDHLEQAAAKAVELASELTEVQGDLEIEARAAQHLTYLAGLIRGGAARRIEEPSVAVPVSEEPFVVKPWIRGRDLPVDPDKLNRIEDAAKVDPLANRTSPAIDPRTAAANFRASAVKVGEGFGPHSNTWQAGLRHGYLMAADALDEVADEDMRFVDGLAAEKNAAVDAWAKVSNQRDELLAAVRKFLDEDGMTMTLRETVDRIEAE